MGNVRNIYEAIIEQLIPKKKSSNPENDFRDAPSSMKPNNVIRIVNYSSTFSALDEDPMILEEKSNGNFLIKSSLKYIHNDRHDFNSQFQFRSSEIYQENGLEIANIEDNFNIQEMQMRNIFAEEAKVVSRNQSMLNKSLFLSRNNFEKSIKKSTIENVNKSEQYFEMKKKKTSVRHQNQNVGNAVNDAKGPGSAILNIMEKEPMTNQIDSKKLTPNINYQGPGSSIYKSENDIVLEILSKPFPTFK